MIMSAETYWSRLRMPTNSLQSGACVQRGPGRLLLPAAPAPGIAADPAVGAGDKLQEFDADRIVKLAACVLQGVGAPLPGAKQCVVKLAQFEALRGTEPGAPQTDDIEACDSIVAARDAKRRQILADARASLHQGQAADATELVDDAIAGNEGPVAERDMPREQGAVGDDVVGADLAVVSDMAAGHEEILVPNDRVLLELGGPMHRAVFAEHISLTDAQSRGRSAVFEVLGRVADDRAAMEPVIGANEGVAGDVDVRPHTAAGAQHHIGIDHGKRADDGPVTDLCSGVDTGKGMDLWGRGRTHVWK